MNGWRIRTGAGLTVLRCGDLDGMPWIGHAFSTRVSGEGAEFDLANDGVPAETASARRVRLLGAAELRGSAVVEVRQVHGNTVVRIDRVQGVPEADAVVVPRSEVGRAAGIRTADCVPILLADAAGGAVAAVHAGWRGTAAGIVGRAVLALAAEGVDPAKLRAAVGPAIGVCCYRVDLDVVEAIATVTAGSRSGWAVTGRGETRVDLGEANRRQLVAAGVPADAVSRAPWCTACREDLLFSYRRDGFRAGRMLAVIGFRDRTGDPRSGRSRRSLTVSLP